MNDQDERDARLGFAALTACAGIPPPVERRRVVAELDHPIEEEG